MPNDWRTNSVRADRIRENLIEIYGDTCAGCGTTDAHLEVNHIYGRDWVIRRLNRYCRFLRYFKEAQQGKINLLCPDCNKRYQPKRNEVAPGSCPHFAAWLEQRQPF